jgi:hypothetical protein
MRFLIQAKVRPVGPPPVLETRPGVIERIISELKPEKIMLLGWYGNSTAGSYVDLLAIVKTKAKEMDRYGAASKPFIRTSCQ